MRIRFIPRLNFPLAPTAARKTSVLEVTHTLGHGRAFLQFAARAA